MADPVSLDRDQLLPILTCLMRRADATRHRVNLVTPLPVCPACDAEPTEVIDSVDHAIGRPARLHFRPCGHEFTASDEDILDVWQVAHDLVEQQKNRPAGERLTALCPQVRHREQHNVHEWFAPVDGRARCPGYDADDDDIPCGQRGCCSGSKPSTPTDCAFCGNREKCINHPGPEALSKGIPGHHYSPSDPNPAVTAKMHAPAPRATVDRPPSRLYEVRTIHGEAYWADGDVIEQDADWLTIWGDEMAIALRVPTADLRALRIADVPEWHVSDDVPAPDDLEEARMWARHGYEIGQRHCGWGDHGVAPAWLTEGWPLYAGVCKHVTEAAEYDTALARVRDLPDAPKFMDAQYSDPAGYLHGYKVAIGDAKRAARTDPAITKENHS
jgi:hypothetical protein